MYIHYTWLQIADNIGEMCMGWVKCNELIIMITKLILYYIHAYHLHLIVILSNILNRMVTRFACIKNINKNVNER